MPLFFFISGFFSYASCTKTHLKKNIINKILGLLIPAFIVGPIFFALNNIDITEALYDINKRGYWFTITLFEIFTTYASIRYVLDKSSIKSNIQDFIFISLLIIFSIITIPSHTLDQYGWWKLLSGFWFVKYTPFFLWGVITKKYLCSFIRCLHNQYVMAICIILFSLLTFYPSTIGRAIQAYLGILIVFALFEKYQYFFNHTSIVGDKLSIIGRQTLPIYLLHYFLLSGVHPLKEFIQFLSSNNSWIGYCSILALSLLIIFICLMIEKIMSISTILHSLLFGFRK